MVWAIAGEIRQTSNSNNFLILAPRYVQHRIVLEWPSRTHPATQVLITGVSVEKTRPRKNAQKTFALGCPYKRRSQFSGHFLSPHFGAFHARPDFFNSHRRFHSLNLGKVF